MKLVIPSYLVHKYVKCGVCLHGPSLGGLVSFTVIRYVDSHVGTSGLSRIFHYAVTAVSTSDHGQGTM